MKKIFVIFILVFVPVSYFLYDTNSQEYKPTILSSFEEVIKKNLKSPTSYKLIEANFYVVDQTPTIHIEYDANNSFNAPIRGRAVAKFAKGVIMNIGSLERDELKKHLDNKTSPPYNNKDIGKYIFEISEIIEIVTENESIKKGDYRLPNIYTSDKNYVATDFLKIVSFKNGEIKLDKRIYEYKPKSLMEKIMFRLTKMQ